MYNMRNVSMDGQFWLQIRIGIELRPIVVTVVST